MGKLDNLGAIVTGSAEGIGEAIANLYVGASTHFFHFEVYLALVIPKSLLFPGVTIHVITILLPVSRSI